MSRQNKVNPDRYKTAGRLSPDELAREREAQHSATPSDRPRRGDERPTWMRSEPSAPAGDEKSKAESKQGEEQTDEDQGSA